MKELSSRFDLDSECRGSNEVLAVGGRGRKCRQICCAERVCVQRGFDSNPGTNHPKHDGGESELSAEIQDSSRSGTLPMLPVSYSLFQKRNLLTCLVGVNQGQGFQTIVMWIETPE